MQVSSYNRKLNFLIWAELLSHILKYTFFSIYSYGIVFDTTLTVISVYFLIGHLGDLQRKQIYLFWAILIFVLISTIVNLDNSGLGGIYTILRFVIYYLLLPCFQISKSEMKIISLLFLLQLFLLTLVDTRNYNTNTLGLIYFIIGVYSTFILDCKKKIHFLFFIVVSAYVIQQIGILECRTTMIAYFFYVILRLCLMNFLYIKRVRICILLFLTIGSVVYAKAYVLAYDGNLISDDVVAVSKENTGKAVFSGRQYIWKECFELIEKKSITGTGSQIKLKSFKSVNIHNSFLNILVIYGLFVGILCLYLISFSLSDIKYDKESRNPFALKGLAIYYSFLLIGFAETVLLVFPFISIMGLVYICDKK